ncbi:cystatin-A2-like isoform X3 [Bradysia coprophila]|uniref:cystatin-A2-like isoform X3 n=1 Tax=Bradysia coprophila TaxID=38358 RepID=UPI00187DC3C6|nr:cystatin-A2-like isoform X3 [Bradysia coprophila]XP_037041014.1 cystatin-A2-like isoform X3 [Bradysia coprophila]
MTKFFIFTVVVFAAIIMSTKAQRGGLGASKPVDAEVTELIERQKENIIKKICDSGSSCPTSDAKIVINSYKKQTVSGSNYFVGLTIDDIIYHVKIYSQPWTQTEEVHAVQGPKTVTDEISYFF